MQIYLYENKENDFKHKSSKPILLNLAKENLWGQVSYSSTGKPLIENGFVSVSHTRNLLLIAYETFPIGIDCEFPREISNHLIDRLSLNPDHPLITWCSLEAWIKLDDKPQHLTHNLPSNVIFKEINLGNQSTCIIASREKIETINIIKKNLE